MFVTNPELQLTEATFQTEKFSSIKSLQAARDHRPDVINSLVTYAYGSDSKYRTSNFPLLFYTQGMGRKRAVKSLDGAFEARMYGNPKKTSRVARTLTYPLNKPGLGGKTTFNIVFEDKWFMKGQTLYCGQYASVQVRVQRDPERDPKGGFLYTVQLIGGKPTAFVSLALLAKGTEWGGGLVHASLLRSKGTEQRSQNYFKMKNQIGLYRDSFNWAGNISNKVLNFSLKVEGKTISYWTEWEKYQHEMSLLEKKEVDFLFSHYNANTDGHIDLLDEDSNEPVPMGMGVWDQITQSLEYGVMTESKLDNFITDIIYNSGEQASAGERVIIGGTGLINSIDQAMKNKTNSFSLINADLYTKKNGDGSLQFGEYFTSYKHRSGVVFKFQLHKAFDNSPVAKASGRHPLHKNMNNMSFCGMALDFAMVDVDKKLTGTGQESNIMFLYEDGREMEEWMVLGGTRVPGKTMSDSRATDQDQSSWHTMGTQGAHVNYPGLCAKILFKG